MSEAVSGHRTFHVLEAIEASPSRGRRTWSRAAKARIVAEAAAPGARVSSVARANGVDAQQIFRWRREARPACAAPTVAMASRIDLVEVEREPTPEAGDASFGLCEIVVADVVLRVGPGVCVERVAALIRAARAA